MEAVFPLDRNFRRPVVSISSLNNIRALIDTGARVSVWTFSEKELEEIGGVKQNRKISFGGFGGQTVGELYTLDLWMAKDRLFFKDVPLIVNNVVQIRCPLILSALCFDKIVYEIDPINDFMKLSAPENQPVIRRFSYTVSGSGAIEMFAQE